MSAFILVKCLCCKREFKARVADRKRGWGKFCSKSCKAIKQESKTGQYANILKIRSYQQEYGGSPSFDKHGNYEGFVDIPGSDEHDCNKD